jgi:hypothetical protein
LNRLIYIQARRKAFNRFSTIIQPVAAVGMRFDRILQLYRASLFRVICLDPVVQPVRSVAV